MAKKIVDDPKALLAQIEQEELEMFADYQAKAKANREKKLAATIDPLRKRREEIDTEIRALETEGYEIDAQISTLTGTKGKKGKRGTGTRQPKRSAEEIKKWADSVVSTIKATGKDGIGAAEISKAIGSPLKGNWLDVVKEKSGDKNIIFSGGKRSRKYYWEK